MWILGILARLDKFARPARLYFEKKNPIVKDRAK